MTDRDIMQQALAACKEERALRERLAQSKQEPVAWMFQHDETGRMNYVSNDGIHNPTMFLEMNPRYALVCPLYTAPPQRTEQEPVELWIKRLNDAVLAEREACAKVCEELFADVPPYSAPDCAAAIRART